MSDKLDEMVPVVAITVKPMSLATRLAAAASAKSQPVKMAAPAQLQAKDEECYEDKNGNVVPCKKCAKNMEKNKVANNKYIGMREKALIVNFLKSINEKNYAQAHKYLKNIMETKLANRIAKNKGVKLF